MCSHLLRAFAYAVLSAWNELAYILTLLAPTQMSLPQKIVPTSPYYYNCLVTHFPTPWVLYDTYLICEYIFTWVTLWAYNCLSRWHRTYHNPWLRARVHEYLLGGWMNGWIDGIPNLPEFRKPMSRGPRNRTRSAWLKNLYLLYIRPQLEAKLCCVLCCGLREVFLLKGRDTTFKTSFMPDPILVVGRTFWVKTNWTKGEKMGDN